MCRKSLKRIKIFELGHIAKSPYVLFITCEHKNKIDSKLTYFIIPRV